MIWRFRKEIIFLILVYFSSLVNRFYLSRDFSSKSILKEKKIVNYSEIIEENKRLREILNLKQNGSLSKFVVANVISFRPYLFPAEIVIDKGMEDKIKEGMVAITDHLYLVGKVEKVKNKISYVSTVFNSKTKISAVISSTGEVGVIEGGTTPFLFLKYISRDSKIKIGDEVITSGYSDYFPSGVKIGKVVKIEKQSNSLFLKVFVKPYCMFSYLKEVLIGKEKDYKGI